MARSQAMESAAAAGRRRKTPDAAARRPTAPRNAMRALTRHVILAAAAAAATGDDGPARTAVVVKTVYGTRACDASAACVLEPRGPRAASSVARAADRRAGTASTSWS